MISRCITKKTSPYHAFFLFYYRITSLCTVLKLYSNFHLLHYCTCPLTVVLLYYTEDEKPSEYCMVVTTPAASGYRLVNMDSHRSPHLGLEPRWKVPPKNLHLPPVYPPSHAVPASAPAVVPQHSCQHLLHSYRGGSWYKHPSTVGENGKEILTNNLKEKDQ